MGPVSVSAPLGETSGALRPSHDCPQPSVVGLSELQADMNSAAVIGRQLRQQQTTGRTSGPLVPPSPHRGRPRTPSHQPTQQPPIVQQPAPSGSGQSKQDKTEKPKGLAKMKSCVSCQCIWMCCKALSGGMLMIAIGIGMTVFGFYADSFAVQEVQEGNKTVEVIDESKKYHFHNLTFVGPVFMGLGGMLIVAACVLSFEANEANARVVPMKGRRPSDADGMLTEQLIDGPVTKERRNGPNPASPFLNQPQMTTFVPEPAPPTHIPDKGGGARTTVAEVQTVAVIPNGPSREKRPQLPLPLRTSPPPPPPTRTTNKKRRNFLSPLIDEFVPSPQDIQIPDPDGCTPDSLCTLEMDVYVTKCPMTVRVQLEPRYLASIESDGLSDSDTAESEFTSRGRFCSPCEVEEQDIPLLGRCSPPSSPEYPLEPLLKRDGNRRFPLLRQTAFEDARLYEGSAEGGSR